MVTLRGSIHWVIVAVLVTGCSRGDTKTSGTDVPKNTAAEGPSSPWFGIPSACKYVVECVNDATGWILNKNNVSVVKVSGVLSGNVSGEHMADFKITVNAGNSSFETVAKDVPCDEDGIPTEAAVDKLRESVEDIKSKIKRLQI